MRYFFTIKRFFPLGVAYTAPSDTSWIQRGRDVERERKKEDGVEEKGRRREGKREGNGTGE